MNSETEQAKKNIPCPLNMTLLQRKSKCAVIVVSKTRLGIFGSGLMASTYALIPARTACQKSLFALTPQNSMTVTITDIVMLGMKPVPRDMLKKLFLEKAAKSFLLS